MTSNHEQSMRQPKPGRPYRYRWPNRQLRRERPTGVTLIAAWHFVSAVTLVVAALFSFNIASSGGILTDTDVLEGAAWLYMMVAPISLALGVGLWVLARWAWVLAVSLAILTLTFAFFNGSPSWANLTGALISVAIVYYLVQPSTRLAFRISPGSARSLNS